MFLASKTWHKFLVQWTFIINMAHNNDDTDDASLKHSCPIKPCSFGHMHASLQNTAVFCLVQETCPRKILRKEAWGTKIVHVDLYSFLYNSCERVWPLLLMVKPRPTKVYCWDLLEQNFL